MVKLSTHVLLYASHCVSPPANALGTKNSSVSLVKIVETLIFALGGQISKNRHRFFAGVRLHDRGAKRERGGASGA